MANFMKAFEDQREDYLAHYGKKGMRWGVITSEYEPVGNQPGQQQDSMENPEYSQQDQESMQKSADAVRQADAESVKDKRKRIVKNIVKGVAIGAIVAGIAVGAAKGYAKKQTGEKQDLATSIGIIGQKLKSKPGQIGDAVKKGFNMDTDATKAANETAQARKRAERAQAAKDAINAARDKVKAGAQGLSDTMGRVKDVARESIGKFSNTFNDAKKNFEAKSQTRSQASEALKTGLGEAINLPGGQGRFKSGTKKMDFDSVAFDRTPRNLPGGQGQFKPGTKSWDEYLKRKGLKNTYNSNGYAETRRSRIYRG